ncbi:MAG: hypothetical protein D6695_07830 [Planctomycetota bacterium]|nr:MAG: hypothetical protein D6695_07830 [Planctomycetota bacterium]
MKADYLTFRRGASVSILGFFIQLLLTLAFLIYSQYAKDVAAFTASLYLGIGLLVWLALGIMFDLHRRERLEALEIESLAASDTGSAFQTSEDEIREAARRLAFMQRYFVPGISLVIALALIGAGWWRFGPARQVAAQDDAVTNDLAGWAIAIGIGAAFVGFVFARFVAGMAKQKVWASLRAGAAFAVGSALFGLAMAVAHFIGYAGSEDVALRYLPGVYSVVMIVLGCEIVVNFALDVYRPRRPGELPRPAFDSRVLGFLAAPDKIAESLGEAINYQFGVDVTGTWFYQLLSRSVVALGAVAIVTGWLLTGLVVVEPHQRAMILTWGKITREDVGPGLHVKWPWPISTIEIPEYTQRTKVGDKEVVTKTKTTAGVRVLHIGTNPPDNEQGPILWTKQHALNEQFLIVQPSHVGEDEVKEDTGAPDVALVAVEVPVQYVVSNVRLFDQIASPEMRDELLTAIGRRAVMQYAGTLSIDHVLATDRTGLAAKLRSLLEAEFGKLNDGQGAGIEILFVGVEGVHPPMKVAPKYEQVVSDRQKMEMAIEDAQQKKIELLAKAAGSVEMAERIARKLDQLDVLIASGASEEEIAAHRLEIQHDLESAGGEMGAQLIEASATRWARHMGERGQAALHEGQVASYEAAPQVYRAKKYFEALSQAMADARVYIVPERIGNITIELQDKDAATPIFDPSAGEPE